MVKRQLLLLSSSWVYGYQLMEQPKPFIIDFFKKNNVSEVLFVPYAKANGDYEGYTKLMSDAISAFGYNVKGIHTFEDPIAAVNSAQCVYIGGGNTFVLLKKLHDLNLVEPLRKRVLEDGMAFMGSSAGTNIATVSIATTNDMPIVYPPTFNALNFVPFNINPHYFDADPNSHHMGETREARIKEFHALNNATVLGLCEGGIVLVDDNKATLKGTSNSKVFKKNAEPVEITPETDISYLLQ